MSEQVASKESATAEPNAPQPGRGKVQAIANAIEPRPKSIACPPESVNWYLTPICNYRCGFCFFTVKGYEELKPLSTGMFMQPDLARTLLARLRDSGTKKVTFVGGGTNLGARVAHSRPMDLRAGHDPDDREQRDRAYGCPT